MYSEHYSYATWRQSIVKMLVRTDDFDILVFEQGMPPRNGYIGYGGRWTRGPVVAGPTLLWGTLSSPPAPNV